MTPRTDLTKDQVPPRCKARLATVLLAGSASITSAANARAADDIASVAYWYQAEPHAPFPKLPWLAERLREVVEVPKP